MAASPKTIKPHAILIPYPLQGHVIPFVRLAMNLATNGFTITFVNTQAIHHKITKARDLDAAGEDEEDIFSGARDSGLDIRYVTVNDGFPIGFDRSLNHDEYFESIMHDFSARVDELVGNLVASSDSSSSSSPLNCLIVDTFYVWGSTISKKYNLVYTSFWTEPALVFTLYYHLHHLLREDAHFSFHDNQKNVIDYVPGIPAIDTKDFPSYLHSKDSPLVRRILHKGFEDVKKADLVICNTVEELESDTISALQQSQPFYAIGPIFSTGFVATSLWSESDCTRWLDDKPHGSVLYVSFGSYAPVSKRDLWEVARGLALSQVYFIWVLRPDILCSDETDLLPWEFEEDVRGKGLVVPWCRQVDVISHPAVGGFLTHCGWNSILESVWCCVPLLCFPLLTDQFTNRKLVVDDWGIGIDLCDEKTITKEEVAKKIGIIMGGKSAAEMKKKIKGVKLTFENVLAVDGSSKRNFHRFIHDVHVEIRKKQVNGK